MHHEVRPNTINHKKFKWILLILLAIEFEKSYFYHKVSQLKMMGLEFRKPATNNLLVRLLASNPTPFGESKTCRTK